MPMKKPTGNSRKSPNVKPLKSAPGRAPSATPVRNSAVPKVQPAAAARREVTHEMIARRAYEIWCSGTGGDQMSNWMRAERELREGSF